MFHSAIWLKCLLFGFILFYLFEIDILTNIIAHALLGTLGLHNRNLALLTSARALPPTMLLSTLLLLFRLFIDLTAQFVYLPRQHCSKNKDKSKGY